MTLEQRIEQDVFFLDTPAGKRFAKVTRPASAPKGGWLYLHPFAEEMNKSRRMAALGTQTLARHGWLVLQIDFAGCGDSAGEFGDTSWQAWLDDISHGWKWLNDECSGVLGIWALRAGSLLAAEWLKQRLEHPPLLLWQPVRNGQQHLAQFLRLKAASEMLTEHSKGAVTELRAELKAGNAVEVAGYLLSPALAVGLNSSHLRLPENYRGSVTILELVAGNVSEPSPGISALVKEWREVDVSVTVGTAHGQSFWQTVEIETAPALIEATLCELEKLTL